MGTSRRGLPESNMLSRIEQFRRNVLDADGLGSEVSSRQTSLQYPSGASPARTNLSNADAGTNSPQRASDAFAALRALGALRDGGIVSAGDGIFSGGHGSLTTALHA